MSDFRKFEFFAGRSSNGRTPDSESGYRGSSPCLPAKTYSDVFGPSLSAPLNWRPAFFYSNAIVQPTADNPFKICQRARSKKLPGELARQSCAIFFANWVPV